MIKDNLYIGEDTRNKLMEGVRKVANVVGVTMGSAGSNSLIECLERPGHFTTNDGATILSSIKLADLLEEMGRMILYEAVSRANRLSGDGSSTTAVLTAAILEEGKKYIGKNSPMEIKRSLERCIPLIEESIKRQAKEITLDTVKAVASISAEDEEIGQMIQEIYQKIGKNGIIQWDISKIAKDYYTIGAGLTIDGATYVSPYMCDVDDKSGAFLNGIRWHNAMILLCRQKITSARDFNDLLSSLFQQGKKELVIFCDDIEFPAIADFVKTRIERGFKTVVVKMPVIWKDEWWEDLALASGATIVDGVLGTLQNLQESWIGKVEHLIVTKEGTYIDGIKDLSWHITELESEGSENALLRASRLNLKTGRYFVGAQSESALAYKRLKVEDAINSASCALEHGIVAGGGVALINAIKILPSDEIGGIILKEALKAPFKQIIYNTGKETISFVGDNSLWLGVDSRSGEVVNMFERGIVDAADVVLNAVKNAIGVAASILTVSSIITLPREDLGRQTHGTI